MAVSAQPSRHPLVLALLIAAGALVWAARAQDGPGTMPAAPSVPARLATCDIYRVAERLMKQPQYADPLQAAKERGDRELEPLVKELEELRDRIERAGPQNSREDIATFQQKQQAFQQTQQRLERDFDRLVAQTNSGAFLAVVEAARRVAQERGYSHVFSTRPADGAGSAETQLQFTLGILARPVVVFPEQDDISEAVMTEMKLD